MYKNHPQLEGSVQQQEEEVLPVAVNKMENLLAYIGLDPLVGIEILAVAVLVLASVALFLSLFFIRRGGQEVVAFVSLSASLLVTIVFVDINMLIFAVAISTFIIVIVAIMLALKSKKLTKNGEY